MVMNTEYQPRWAWHNLDIDLLTAVQILNIYLQSKLQQGTHN